MLLAATATSPENLNFVEKLGYYLTESSYFFKNSMSHDVEHLHGFGLVFLVAICLLSLGQFIVGIICYNKYAAINKDNFSDLKFERLFRIIIMFVIIFLPIFIDLIFSILAALIAVQLSVIGFCILGIIYIILRGGPSIATDQEDGSGWGITRSIASFFGETFKRNKILKNYKKLYYTELNRSNNLWAQIKQ